MPKWTFPIPQSCGVLTEIRFMQICLNHVRMDKYVGSPEILWMTLWGITASTLFHKTFMVVIISPVKRHMPFVRLVVLMCSCSLVFE